MKEEFISEAIEPDPGTLDTERMAAGEPGLPMSFKWRGRTVRVAQVVRSWKDTGACRHGSGEKYIRKHWYEVLTDQGEKMKLYFERQPRAKSKSRQRWWLYSKGAREGEA